MHEESRIRADDRGVWVEDGATSRRYGIEWGEIFRVHGSKLDLIDSECTILELDFSFGEFIELNSLTPGFAEVVEAMTARLGLDADWFQQIERLAPLDAPITVWRRPGDRD